MVALLPGGLQIAVVNLLGVLNTVLAQLCTHDKNTAFVLWSIIFAAIRVSFCKQKMEGEGTGNAL